MASDIPLNYGYINITPKELKGREGESNEKIPGDKCSSKWFELF